MSNSNSNTKPTDFDGLFINASKVLVFIFQNKIKILIISFLSGILFYTFSFSQDVKYYSESLITSQNPSNTASGSASSMGGLSSVMGINFNQGTPQASDFQIALELIKSRQFILKFIKKYDLTPKMIAVKEYDERTETIIFDNQKYIKKTSKLLVNPSNAYLYNLFTNSISISKKDSFYRIGFTSKSPKISQKILEDLIAEINDYIRNKNLNETIKTFDYLEKKSLEVKDINTKNIINSLLEEQLKDMALINSSSEYVLRVIDPPYFPEFRSSPNRSYFIILGLVFGFFLGIAISLIAANKKYY